MSVAERTLASPFKGLAAFADTELDARLFFGREREREVLVANLLASRLTVLYGESGVGKSSLLAAAVVRDLRQVASNADVALIDTWSGPVTDALANVRGAFEGYLILDQFEEYFLYHGDDGRGALLDDLPDLLNESRVNVLIALREDSLARLDAFKARIPAVFSNQVRLEHLDRAAARAAILGPVARWNELQNARVEVEPALVEAVLDEVAVEGRARARDRIEAPYLQLVLEQIWETERRAESMVLRLETLRALGGARTIVREHLDVALAALEPDEQDVAASIFDHLVTPSGTKIAHLVTDLADYADVPEQRLRNVLITLTHDRIVHSVDGSDRYEIFHDVLAEPIRAWREQRRFERVRTAARRRQRRLAIVAGFSLCALAVVAALAVWAFSERGSARSQAKHARARVLEATALQQLPADPNRSVSLALAAARLEGGPTAEAVLRQALIADRLRLVRHTPGPVRAIAASPRGDLVATAISGATVLLLEAHNRRLLRAIRAPRTVAAVSFAAGGRTLITASPQGLAQVWDVATGRRLPVRGRVAGARMPQGTLALVALSGRLAATISHVRRISINPERDRIAAAVAQPDGHVQAWLFDGRGRLLRVLPEHGVRDVEFSPDGRLLATAGADGFTLLLNARTGRLERTLREAKSGVQAVAFSPDGKLLATGGLDGGVRIWTTTTGERLFFFTGHTNPVSAVAWSPDGRVVASASLDRTVRLWAVQHLVDVGSPIATLSGDAGAVRALAFSRSGDRLVTGGDAGTVRFWDTRPDQELELLGQGPGPALAARWAGATIAGLWPRLARTYDAHTRAVIHTLRAGPGARLTSLALSGNGSVLAAGGADGATLVWDARSGKSMSLRRGRSPLRAVAVSPDGSLVVTGDRRGIVRIWSVRGRRLLWSAQQRGGVADVAFSPSADALATVGPRGATLWSVESGRPLHQLPVAGGAREAAFSPDGRFVATADEDASARVWFAKSGNPYRVLRGHAKPLTDVVFSRDVRRIATSSEDADVRLWSVSTGRGRVVQRGAFGPITAIAFDPSGRWVAAAAPISVIMWTVSSGRQLFYLRGHRAQVTGVSFAPQGTTVLSSSRDGTLRTYTCDVCADLSALVHQAEVRLAQTG